MEQLATALFQARDRGQRCPRQVQAARTIAVGTDRQQGQLRRRPVQRHLVLSGEVLRVGFDGETEVLDRVNIVGPPVVLGDRIFSVEGCCGLFELNAGGAPTLLQDGENLQLLVPDVTGTRTLLTSRKRTDDSADLDVRLLDPENLLGAPITLRGFAGFTVRSWTCGSGCWELGTPYGNERWRVVLEGAELRATRLPDAARPIEVAAGDACRSVQVERDGLAYVLASPSGPRPLGLARAVDLARVREDRFWVVSAERDRGLVVRSVEP